MDLNETNIKKVIKVLSEEWADKYQSEYRIEPEGAKQLLNDPRAGLEFLLKKSFFRAVGAQAGYVDIAAQALGKA